MDADIMLNQKQLASRWSLAPETLANWRTRRIGPRYIRLHGRRGPVLYRVKDIRAYEREQTIEMKAASVGRK